MKIKIIIAVTVVILFIILGIYLLLRFVSNQWLPGDNQQNGNGEVTLLSITPFAGAPEEELDPEELQQILEDQAASEEQFAKDSLARDLEYPWLNRLPLIDDRYFAYYDIETDQLLITLYATDTPALREEIEDALFEKSIPYTIMEVVWESE